MSAEHDDILGKAYDARLMRRLLTYLRPHLRSVAVSLAAIAAYSALQLVPPYLTKIAIDDHIATGDIGGLNGVAAAFLVVLVGSFGLEYVQTYTMQMMGQRIMYDLRMEIYRHLQRLDVAFYDRNPVGRLMTRVTTDVDTLNDLFASGVIAIGRDVFTLAGIMVFLLWIDWRLALVAFSVLPAIALVTHWFRVNARESYRQVRGWVARINAFLQENITGMATVQLFRAERRHLARFDAVNRELRDAHVASIFYYATFYPAVELLGAVATALLLWYGGGRSLQGAVELGALVAFIQYAQRFFRPISDLSEKFNILQSAMASSERIFGLLDTPVAIRSGGHRAHRVRGAGRVRVAGRALPRPERLPGPRARRGPGRFPHPLPGPCRGRRPGPGTFASRASGSPIGTTTTCCATSRSTSRPASGSGWWGRRGRARRRSSTC